MAKVITIKQKLEEASEEEEADSSIAIKEYEEVIKADPLAEKTYDRLMILYRKEKYYKKELKLIDSGIKAFEKFYRSKKTGSKKIADISNKLNKSFGFTDKKGNAVYEPEPIAKWKKRRLTVDKRIK